MAGLDFVVSNFASAMDEEQHSPIGFDVIFPSMVEKALTMEVNLHLVPTDIDAMLQKKDSELKRYNSCSFQFSFPLLCCLQLQSRFFCFLFLEFVERTRRQGVYI